MFKQKFYQALLAGVLAAVAAIIYNRIYFFATEADFSKVLNPVRLVALSLIISLLAAFLNYSLTRSGNKSGEIIFNFLFSIISFAAVMIPISYTLPLDLKFPELFPGLAVPMVFFPAIAWYTVNPLFAYKLKQIK
jgi:H+/Cl- antiporter ClcA